MSTRFAEKLDRKNPLDLKQAEEEISKRNIDQPNCLRCEEDIYLGFFFDGTNNNKYRDTPGNCHSNVARLYEAYVGYPTVSQLAIARGSPLPDKKAVWPSTLSSARDNYRKTDIPGVDTPFQPFGPEQCLALTDRRGHSAHLSCLRALPCFYAI
ncbi:hypothetical protein N8I74_17745 [Chitiniphilus purpureus]|uniref:DUF2235 domain-containing protein n=1 Tax=Chitiniphilus purpureus TaxID=2981137 RepID=A0ABY6DL97_9NEIS|nr:hypothetical protein [Chitiniphilus sp. CD1]UXY15134.1 hypothetical protein N8I74_17745 [Chitiniphilus sp. CD1]